MEFTKFVQCLQIAIVISCCCATFIKPPHLAVFRHPMLFKPLYKPAIYKYPMKPFFHQQHPPMFPSMIKPHFKVIQVLKPKVFMKPIPFYKKMMPVFIKKVKYMKVPMPMFPNKGIIGYGPPPSINRPRPRVRRPPTRIFRRPLIQPRPRYPDRSYIPPPAPQRPRIYRPPTQHPVVSDILPVQHRVPNPGPLFQPPVVYDRPPVQHPRPNYGPIKSDDDDDDDKSDDEDDKNDDKSDSDDDDDDKSDDKSDDDDDDDSDGDKNDDKSDDKSDDDDKNDDKSDNDDDDKSDDDDDDDDKSDDKSDGDDSDDDKSDDKSESDDDDKSDDDDDDDDKSDDESDDGDSDDDDDKSDDKSDSDDDDEKDDDDDKSDGDNDDNYDDDSENDDISDDKSDDDDQRDGNDNDDDKSDDKSDDHDKSDDDGGDESGDEKDGDFSLDKKKTGYHDNDDDNMFDDEIYDTFDTMDEVKTNIARSRKYMDDLIENGGRENRLTHRPTQQFHPGNTPVQPLNSNEDLIERQNKYQDRYFEKPGNRMMQGGQQNPPFNIPVKRSQGMGNSVGKENEYQENDFESINSNEDLFNNREQQFAGSIMPIPTTNNLGNLASGRNHYDDEYFERNGDHLPQQNNQQDIMRPQRINRHGDRLIQETHLFTGSNMQSLPTNELENLAGGRNEYDDEYFERNGDHSPQQNKQQDIMRPQQINRNGDRLIQETHQFIGSNMRSRPTNELRNLAGRRNEYDDIYFENNGDHLGQQAFRQAIMRYQQTNTNGEFGMQNNEKYFGRMGDRQMQQSNQFEKGDMQVQHTDRRTGNANENTLVTRQHLNSADNIQNIQRGQRINYQNNDNRYLENTDEFRRRYANTITESQNQFRL